VEGSADGREKCTRFWWQSPKEKIPLGRLRRSWEDGIRMDLGETGLEGVVWIQLAQDDWWRVPVNVVINFRVLGSRS
jgi:hypothetical protein